MTDLVPVSENVAGAPTVLGDPRARWLAARRELVTASDVAAILGHDPRRGAFKVWAEKLGFIEPEDAPWMRRGRRFEAPIAEEYGEETGRPVFAPDPYEIAIHPDVPWLGSTLDRETEGCEASPAPAPGRAPLELKNVSGLKAKEWRADPPKHFQIQVQVQIACTRAQWASLAAIIAGLQLVWKDVLRHDRFIANMLPALDRFRWHVRQRIPPEADGLPGTTAALKALYPPEGDGSTRDLGADALEVVERWEEAKERKRIATAEERAERNRLLALVQSSSLANLPDGTWLRRRSVEREAYEVEETTYSVLKREWPRLPRRS